MPKSLNVLLKVLQPEPHPEEAHRRKPSLQEIARRQGISLVESVEPDAPLQGLFRKQHRKPSVKPSLQEMARREGIEPVHAPYAPSAVELFRRLISNTKIMFLVNGERLGLFVFQRNPNGFSFTCYSEAFDPLLHEGDDTGNGPCIRITIRRRDVHLNDYFYYATRNGYECEKPNSMRKHKMILNTLLEFLAYAFQKREISLQDAASRKYTHCPPLWTGIYLVAGHPTFYEKAAGFGNNVASSTADDVGAFPAPPHLQHRGATLRESAQSIIQTCKDEREQMSNDDLVLINYIHSIFHDRFRHVNGSPFMDYKKVTMNMYGCKINHGDGIVDNHLINSTILEPGARIKPYLFMDIITA